MGCGWRQVLKKSQHVEGKERSEHVESLPNFTHVTDRGGVFARVEVNGGKESHRSVSQSICLPNWRPFTAVRLPRAITHTSSFNLYYDEIHAGHFFSICISTRPQV